MRMHSFKNSLAKGKAGEALLAQLWPELTPIEGGRKGDFILGPDKLKVEVKSDSYGLNGSPNFFFERWSDFDRKKPGGVWQSLAHECNLFVYFYPADRVCFVFDVVCLKNVLDSLIPNLAPVLIENQSWTTVGYKVPRAELEHLYEVKDFSKREVK